MYTYRSEIPRGLFSCVVRHVSASEYNKKTRSRYPSQLLRTRRSTENPKNKISNMICCKPLSRSGVPESIRISVSDHRLCISHSNLSSQSPPAECLIYFYYGDLIIRHPEHVIGQHEFTGTTRFTLNSG